MKKIAVVVVNYNGEKNMIECLDSLEEVKKENFELHVVVIDNASKDMFATSNKYKNFRYRIYSF